MRWMYDDGGRAKAGYKGVTAGDCVTRAIAVATGLPYETIYALVDEAGSQERKHKNRRSKSSARTGVYKPTTRRILAKMGWTWHPTMQVGTGCRVHMRQRELPSGRLIVKLSRHLAAVIDGVVYDTHDCTRSGMRCVYGYWTPPTTGSMPQ